MLKGKWLAVQRLPLNSIKRAAVPFWQPSDEKNSSEKESHELLYVFKTGAEPVENKEPAPRIRHVPLGTSSGLPSPLLEKRVPGMIELDPFQLNVGIRRAAQGPAQSAYSQPFDPDCSERAHGE